MRSSPGGLRPSDAKAEGVFLLPMYYFFMSLIYGRGNERSEAEGLVTVREYLNLGRSSWRGIRELQNGAGLKTSWLRMDSNKSSGVRLHEEAGTLVPGGGASAPAVSLNGYRERFFDGVTAAGTMGKGPIGFQNHNQSLFQVPLGFGQCAALGIYTGNFFYGGDVPLAVFHVDRCELTNHVSSISVLMPTGNAPAALP
jgi:hypothetical protein